MPDRVAKVEVSTDLVLAALALPADTELLRLEYSRKTGTFTFTVRHPYLKEVLDGKKLPYTRPILNAMNHEAEEARKYDVWFVSWGDCHDEVAERGDG